MRRTIRTRIEQSAQSLHGLGFMWTRATSFDSPIRRTGMKWQHPHRILVAYDFTHAAEQALHNAAERAEAEAAEVHMLWVNDDLVRYDIGDERLDDEVGRSLERLRRRIDALNDDRQQQGAPGLPVVPHVGRGEASEDILELARQLQADLILVGADDRSKVGRFLFGSVTERVTRLAPCPVLVARPLSYEESGAHSAA